MKPRHRYIILFFTILCSSSYANTSDSNWDVFGTLLLRSDNVAGLPGNRDDFERIKSSLRFGSRYQSNNFEFGVAIRAALASDDNRDNKRNLDNVESNGFDADELYLRWMATPSSELIVGKTWLPLNLSTLVWDPDLRPIGAFLSHTQSGGQSEFIFSANYFNVDHLYNDDSRVAALQAQWNSNPGGNGWSLIGSYLDIDAIDNYPQIGLSRSNRRATNSLLNDFRIANIQIIRSWGIDMPAELTLEWVINTAANDRDDGARVKFTLGGTQQGDWHYAYTYQRIQRDALVAAFNDDDWWFPSWMRGHRIAASYALTDTNRIQVSGFYERRDDQQEHLKRILLDFIWNF